MISKARKEQALVEAGLVAERLVGEARADERKKVLKGILEWLEKEYPVQYYIDRLNRDKWMGD